MDEYNFKFRVVKNIGEKSEKILGKAGTVIEVKDGKFTAKDGSEYGKLSEWTFHALKDRFSENTFHDKTEIELVEESQELTPPEFLKICHEICQSHSSCVGCGMHDKEVKCYDNEEADFEKIYEIAKQWKKDHKEENKEIKASWFYEIVSDSVIVDRAMVELEAMEKCEKYASENPFNQSTYYRKAYGFIEEGEKQWWEK